MDKYREAYLVSSLSILAKLDANTAQGNSHHFLATGPKGTGKTFFLKAMCSTAYLVMNNVISIYFDCAELLVGPDYVPAAGSLILKQIRSFRPELVIEGTGDDITSVTLLLIKEKLSVYLCLDEYHLTYMMSRFSLFRSQIYQMINDTTGRYFVTVAGSSSYLRALCYGKYSPPENGSNPFPGYQGLAGNLNSQRTTELYFGALNTVDEFR
jgi:hypothetical protein